MAGIIITVLLVFCILGIISFLNVSKSHPTPTVGGAGGNSVEPDEITKITPTSPREEMK